MDSRIALAANTQLHVQNKEGGAVRYTIIKEISRGGSCIVYDASYETNTGDVKYVRIKECYPLRLRIERMANGCLCASPADMAQFEEAQKKFASDFHLGNGMFYTEELYDALTTTLDVYSANGTTYLASTFSPENTLATYQPESLRVCVTLIKQVACILRYIHREGYLYLDIKPDNVLVLDTYTTRVQLFDLDSLVYIGQEKQGIPAEPDSARVSFSGGFAAIELQTGKRKKLGRHTDVYGVGALLFYLLFGATPTAADCEPNAVYDFTESKYAGEQYPDKLFFALTDFFHNTLANFYLDRYPDMEPVIKALTRIEALTDPAKPYIKSSVIAAPPVMIGRQKELQMLLKWVDDPGTPCIFVTGMGGIGKSTLVRAFLAQQHENLDNSLYLPFAGTLARTLTDDGTACISTVEKSAKETLEEYYHRKLRAFQGIIKGTKSVLVIDNYPGKVNQELSDAIAVGWKVVLISRKQPIGSPYPVLPVEALTEQADLYGLFEHNLGTRLQPSDFPYLDSIIRQIDGHTLVLELIAKQIAGSYLTVREASELVNAHGFTGIAPEKVIYSKDADVYPETLRNIITALFEADHLTAGRKDLLKVMSLVDSNGIDIRLLHDALEMKSKEDTNSLIRDGWMILNGKTISLHPVIQETVHCWEWSVKGKSCAVRLMDYLFRKLKVEEHREEYPAKLLRRLEVSWALFQKQPRRKEQLERWLKKQGPTGEAFLERLQRGEDPRPADRKQISLYVQLSEGILNSCRREPILLEETSYLELLYRTVLNMPRYREDFIMERAEELLHSSRCQNGAAIMKLYDCILSVYQERKEFDAAAAKLEEAKNAAETFRDNYVWALYYDLLSNFYDHALGGAYDAVLLDEKLLREKLIDATDKAIRYARHSHRPDSKQLLAKNILAKATILMRSGLGQKEQIDKLLAEAERIVPAETQPCSEVRCIFYMAKAWYATLVAPSPEDTLSYIRQADKISKQIVPTDLDEIDNMIVPSADMMCRWKQYPRSAKLLLDGIHSCEQNDSVVPYIRKKMELYRHLLDVCWEWGKPDLCRLIIMEIDDGNRSYQSVGVSEEVPEELRDLVFSGEEPQS